MVWAFNSNLLEAEVWTLGVWHGMDHGWAAKTSQVVAPRGQRNQGQLPTWILAHTSLGSDLIKFHS